MSIIEFYIEVYPIASSDSRALLLPDLLTAASAFSRRNLMIMRQIAMTDGVWLSKLALELGIPLPELENAVGTFSQFGLVCRGNTGKEPLVTSQCRRAVITCLFVDRGVPEPYCKPVRIAAYQRRPVPSKAELRFQSMEDFLALLPPEAFDLLKKVGRECPRSKHSLIRKGERTAGNKRKLIDRLMRAGLLELHPCGQDMRPVLPYDGIEIAIEL